MLMLPFSPFLAFLCMARLSLDSQSFHFPFPSLSSIQRRRKAVLPVVLGVALACYGELEFALIGFVVTALCVFAAAIKVVISGKALTGEFKLHPVDLLAR